MATPKLRVARKIFGYSAFFIFALVVAFFLTFPYRALEEQIQLRALAAGFNVRMGSLGPGFFSLRAKNIEISKKSEQTPPPSPLNIAAASVGPTLFPPGASSTIKILGGKIATKVSGVSTFRIGVDVDELNLAAKDLKDLTGIDFGGDVSAHVDLKGITIAKDGSGEPDLSQASGLVTIEGHQVAINGGSMSVVIPQFGPEPTPLDLPKVLFGEINAKIRFEKGMGTVEIFEAKSSDLEIRITGTLKLAPRLRYSEPTIEVRFKPDPEFQKRLGLVGSVLSAVGPDPADPAWRMATITGYLERPNVR